MWTSVITDRSGVPIGELKDADAREVFIGINRVSTSTCRLRIDHPLAAQIRTDELYLKTYDDQTLRFHGLLTSVEDVVDDNSETLAVNIVSSNPGFLLAKRLAGKSGTGTAYSADKADIAKQMIDTTNASGDTGILTVAVTSGSTGAYTAGPYRPIIECIRDIADSLDGFDWIIDPIEYSAGKVGQFRAAAVIGTTKEDAVFEYGTGRANVRAYRRQKSWESVGNQVFHIHDDGAAADPGPGVVSAYDATSIAARGLWEDIAQAPGLADTTIRTQLCQEHVDVRKKPRQVYSFTPDFDDGTGRVPAYGTDYSVGDTIRARGKYGSLVLFDGYMRVYAVKVAIDVNGQATVSPLLIDEEATA